MKKILPLLSCAFFLSHAYAGQNPLSWSLSPSAGFPQTTRQGNTYVVTYTITNNLPFSVPLTVAPSSTGGSYTIANNCNKTLAAKGQTNSSCLVTISLQPTKVGTNSIYLTLFYNKNRVLLPTIATNTVAPASIDKINGAVTIPLPGETFTGTEYPVEFSYVNTGTVTVTPTSVVATGFTATNNCTAPLAPNSPPCTVTGTFAPGSVGAATLSVVYNYNNGKSVSVPLQTSTVVSQGGGTCHQVTGFTSLPMPTSSFIYADNVVKYVFTNQCETTSETLGSISFTPAGSATLTPGTDTCSGTTLAPNASCSVYLSVVPTATAANLSVTASLPYNNNASTATAVTSEAVTAIPNPTTTHTVMFVNQCDQNVWYEFQNGAGGTKSPDPTPSNANTFADYQLAPQLSGMPPSTKVLSVNEYINGAIYGRTQCNTATGVCATANCAVIPGTGTCQVGVGANNPTTIFESNMTAATGTDGVYDVSVINGFNIPGEVKSLAPIGADAFGCGQAAGALIQPAGSTLGACPWSFTPPSTTAPDAPQNYFWVSSGPADGCTSSCPTAGDVCGMAFTASASSEGVTPINRRCGTFQGYWTIADYIGYSSTAQWGAIDLFTSYDLGTTLPAGPSGSYGNSPALPPNAPATFAAMYGCIVTDNGSLNTGYGTGTPPNPLPNTNACGCYDWNQTGSIAPTAQSSNCTASNSDWTTNVLPRISWLKQACPTAYSYQFDDKSVSFQCNVSGQKTSYQITFCPGGKTGAPGT